MVTSYTPAIGLEKPDYRDPRSDLPLNRNFDKLDSLQGKLAEIAIELSSTVPVDVFIYDTTKDSDGGAYRERCENLVWYNETLGTATRGVTRKIPAIVSIIAEATLVTLYDLTNPAVHMWRVHDFTGYTVTSVFMIQSKLIVGTTVGLYTFDYLSEEEFWYTTSSVPAIANNVINDTAMTILPGAPVDDLTGIQVPTIAVATDGGVSVIDGPAGVDTVVDIAYAGYASGNVLFENGIMWSSRFLGVGYRLVNGLNTIPSADHTTGVYDRIYTDKTITVNSLSFSNTFEQMTSLSSGAIGREDGLTLLKENTLTPSNGMVNYMTDSYLSGWMQGDILMATLADTVAETIGTDVTTEWITNATFDSNVTGWTDNSDGGVTGLSWDASGALKLVELSTESGAARTYTLMTGLTIGQVYELTMDLSGVTQHAVGDVRVRVATTSAGSDIVDVTLGTNPSTGEHKLTFKATATAHYVNLYLYNHTILATTVSVRAFQNLVENWEFSSDRAWVDNNTTHTISAGNITVTNTATNGDVRQTIGTVEAGKTYLLTGKATNGTGIARIYFSGEYILPGGSEVEKIITADVDNEVVSLLVIGGVGDDAVFDYVSLEELQVQDRSVNADHLQVVGELTKAAANTGCELVAYSGFSADNYIEQPYNSSKNPGTGDFSYLFHIEESANSAIETIFERDSDTTAQRVTGQINADGTVSFICDDGTTVRTATSTGVVDDGIFHLLEFDYSSGTLNIYIDNVLDGTATGAALLTLSNTSAIFRIGLDVQGANPLANGSLTLLRSSLNIPSSEQLIEIYETERELFLENAQCTLKSANVKALDWNEDKQELLVGTDSGLNKVVGVVSFDEPLSLMDSVGVINETTNDDYIAVSSQKDIIIHGVSIGSIANSQETNLRTELAVVGGKRQVIDFVPQDPGVPFLEGRVQYEKEHRSLSLFTDIYGVTHNLGQELLLRVYNDSGATILNGTACRHDGAEPTTGFPKIVLALADTFRNAQVIGIATHDIPYETYGFITRSGVVHELDVNGIAVGYPIYLSSTVAGELVGAAPDIISRLGYVLVAGTTGRMLTEIHNNIVLPTLFGLLQAIPDTDVYTLSSTPADMDGYVTDYDTGITVVGSTGYMTIPNSGWYRLTISVTVTVTPGSPAQEHNVRFDLYRTNNTPGVVDFTTLTLPSDSVDVTGSRSATIPFQATAGDILVMQVSSSDSTEDLTFDSSSFDIESISIS